MAEVESGGEQGGKSKGKKRAKKNSTKIDMTPMVDLAFLLLTFFILTTTMSKPTTMQMTFPVDDDENQEETNMKVNNAITMILTKNDEILYYLGELSAETKFQKADYKSIRKIISERNRPAIEKINELTKQFNEKVGGDKQKFAQLEPEYKKMVDSVKGLRASVFCIIKPDEFAKYRNMIDIVDEMDICGVGKYAVSDKFAEAELEYLKNYHSTSTEGGQEP